MTKVVEFQTPYQREVLEGAIAQGFETVFLIGIKDGTVYIHGSANTDTIEKLGMLEAAKLHLYEHWN